MSTQPAAAADGRKIHQRDGAAALFTPISFRSVTAKNRIMVSPMCQYAPLHVRCQPRPASNWA